MIYQNLVFSLMTEFLGKFIGSNNASFAYFKEHYADLLLKYQGVREGSEIEILELYLP